VTLEQRVPLLRDLTCLLVGAAGFGHSVWTDGGWPPLLVSAALMAGPGVVQLWLAGRTPGGGLSSAPEPSVLLPPSASPSSGPSAGDGL
jgi:hypothetical protein